MRPRAPAPAKPLCGDPGIPRPGGSTLELVERLRSCGALRFGEFKLASGATSPYYVDIKAASAEPDVLRALAEAIRPHTTGHDRVAGMALGAVPLAIAVSLDTSLPSLVVRKEAKGHGTARRIEGSFREGDRVLLVEDVTTSGGSAEEAVTVLRGEGLEVTTCVTVVDRGEGAAKRLAEADVDLVPLLSAEDLLEEPS